MTRIHVLALALALSALVSSGSATSAQEIYGSTGPYLGIEGTVAVPVDFEDQIEVLSLGPPSGVTLDGIEVDSSLGFHGRAGWRLHPRIAAEAHFEFLNDFDVSAEDGQRPYPSDSTHLGSVSRWTLTGDLNGYLLTGRVQPFLTAGAGWMEIDADDEDDRVELGFPGDGGEFAVRLGGGIHWYLNEYVAFAVNASYVLPTGSLKDYDYVSAGWGLHFPLGSLLPGRRADRESELATPERVRSAPLAQHFTAAADPLVDAYSWLNRRVRRAEPVRVAALGEFPIIGRPQSEGGEWLVEEELTAVPVMVLAQQSAAEEVQAQDPGSQPAETEDVEPAVDVDMDVEEIVVQGQRSGGLVAEDAAQSVVAFTPDDLSSERITDISDLAEYTPNLSINKGFAASGATIFTRGIGLNDYNANAASSTAVYVDGVYMNSPVGQLFQFFDLQGVEVLRGPQGSLYGRNATAGAILVSSSVPDGNFNGYGSFTYGNFNTVEVEGAIGFPIVPDLLSGRIAGRYASRAGITENRCGTNPNGDPDVLGVVEGQCNRVNPFHGPVPEGLPERVNDIDMWAARGIFRLEPTVNQEWILNVHAGKNRGDAAQLQNRGSRVPPVLDGTGFDKSRYRDQDRDPFAGDYDLVEPEYLDLFGSSLKGEIEIGEFTITSISGYESNERAILDNTDANPRVLIHTDMEDAAWQASQELRVDSFVSEKFDWKAGGFFLYEELEADNSFTTRAIVQNRQVYDQELITWAAFGRFTYEFFDRPCGLVACRFEFEGGARYNWEQKSFGITATSTLLNGSGFDQIQESQTETWDAVTGDAVLRWRPFEDTSIYAKYTRGFKGGHFNGGAYLSAQVVEAVEPETVSSFEVGIDSSWIDGLLGFSFAAFYYDYENYQVFALQNLPGALPLPQLLNAPKVESRGIEIELNAVPAEGLNINLALSLLDAKFEDFEVTRSFREPPCNRISCPVVFKTQDFTGNPLPAAPPIQFTTLASYDIPLGRYGMLVPRVSATYKGLTYFDAGDARSDTPEPNDGVSQDPYWLFNAGLEYRTPNERITVSGWVRNITDQVYLRNSFDLREQYWMILDYFGDPRTYGITVGVEF